MILKSYQYRPYVHKFEPRCAAASRVSVIRLPVSRCNQVGAIRPSASSTGSIGNGAGTLINISEILALLRPAASEWNRLADKEIRFVGREEHTEQCIFTAGCQTRTGHSLEDLLETG